MWQHYNSQQCINEQTVLWLATTTWLSWFPAHCEWIKLNCDWLPAVQLVLCSLSAQLVVTILCDVSYPWQRLVTALLYDLQVTHLIQTAFGFVKPTSKSTFINRFTHSHTDCCSWLYSGSHCSLLSYAPKLPRLATTRDVQPSFSATSQNYRD